MFSTFAFDRYGILIFFTFYIVFPYEKMFYFGVTLHHRHQFKQNNKIPQG